MTTVPADWLGAYIRRDMKKHPTDKERGRQFLEKRRIALIRRAKQQPDFLLNIGEASIVSGYSPGTLSNYSYEGRVKSILNPDGYAPGLHFALSWLEAMPGKKNIIREAVPQIPIKKANRRLIKANGEHAGN